MISVKELTIGDLVNYRPGWINEETNQVEYESGTGFPVRIEMLYYSHGEGFVQYNDGENDGIEAAEYELFPIPITPEILEKNGFEKLDFSHFQIGDRRLVLDADGRWDGPLSWHWVVTEMDTNAKGQPVVLDYYVTTINYVHELQHALRLCGIEKEIKL